MKFLTITILISLLSSSISYHRLVDDELISLLEKVNEPNFDLEEFRGYTFDLCIEDETIKNERRVSCVLSRNLAKHLNARTVLLGFDYDLNGAFDIVITGYKGKKREKTLETKEVKEDYDKLVQQLKQHFVFQKEEFREGGESPETLTTKFSNENGIIIKIDRIIGGGLRSRKINISFYVEGSY